MKKHTNKQGISVWLAGALCCTSFAGVLGVPTTKTTEVAVAQTSAQTFDENNINLTIAAISDPHIGYAGNDQKFNNTLTVLKQFAKNDIDVFLSAGDNTQNGVESEAKYFMEILSSHFDLSKVPAVVTHGNHDTYWSGCMNTQGFYDAYGDLMYTFDVDKNAAKQGNRHIEFEGYHFITVQIGTYMPDKNNIANKAWLTATLKEITRQDATKPIFVVSHSPQMNTIYGSILGDKNDAEHVEYGDISRNDDTAHWGSSRDFDSVLNDYPQAILISGHTHYANNNELAIMQTGYTSFTPGGSADLAANEDTAETASGVMPEARSHSQGTLMEVDKDNNVRITRIDFVKKQQIKDVWIIPAPKADKSHLKPYSAERGKTNTAPTFASAEKLEVTAAGTKNVKVTYPSATDDDMVYSYRITLKNSKNQQLATVTTLSPWIYYPNLADLPKVNTHTFANVSLSYPCKVEVVAIDCWGKESAPLTKTIQDPTQDDIRFAGEFDNKVNSFGSVTENSFADIVALRNEYNAMSYSRQERVTKYAELVTLEKQFYQTYAVSEYVKACAVTDASKYFSTIPSSTRGSIKASDFCGVDITWTGATTNNSVGLNTAFDLNGLTVSFGGLEIESEDKLFGFIFSSVARDKYLEDETLLLQVDFNTGKLYIGSGNLVQYLGASEALLYDNVVSRPAELTILKEDGAYKLVVNVYGMAEEEFVLPQGAVEGASHLSDTTHVFASVTPWAKGMRAKMNLYAIYQKPAKQVQEDSSSSSVSSSEPTTDTNSGCGATTALCVLPVLTAAAFIVNRKRK